MTVPLRRLALSLAVVALLGAACGDDEPTGDGQDQPGASTSAPISDGGSAPPTISDEDVLGRLAEDVADEQRPGEFVEVTNVTFFDDPDGCPSGEAAFVSIELSGEPAKGEVLFCRVDGEPGWELAQGILYGE